MNRWSCFLLALSLIGCARFESRPIPPSETAGALEGRRLDDAGLKKFLETNLGRALEAWPLVSWDLKTLTLAALYFHPSLDLARVQWQAAEAGVRTAGARPNPTLGLTPGYDTSAVNGLSPWIPFFNLDVPLETAGKRGHRVARAQRLSQAARLNIATVAWQVRSGVRANLLDFATANQRAILLEGQVAAQEQIVERLEQRVAAGAISRADVTAARIALARSRLDLGGAKSKRAESRARLAESLGVSEGALAGVTLRFDFSERAAGELTAADARNVALRGRSDILGALADYGAAEAELRLQIARQYPDIHLNPGYQFDQGDNKWTLGITFELPAFNQNQGPIAEAGARREEAAARFTGLQAKVIGEIDRAVTAHSAARDELAGTGEMLAAARQQLRSVEAQLKAGAADPLDLLNAQLELGVATLARLEIQTRLEQSFGALEDALQRPIEATGGTSGTFSLYDTAQRAPDRSTNSAGSDQPGGLR